MTDLTSRTTGFSDEEIRASVYYAARYIKQSEYFEENEKDIFEEEDGSRPTDRMKYLALEIIRFFELRENCLSKQFNDPTFMKVMHELTALEDSLGPQDFEESDVTKKFAAEIELPIRKSGLPS